VTQQSLLASAFARLTAAINAVDAKTGGGSVWKQQMAFAGRLYCYNDARWIAAACDDNYGPGYYQWNEGAAAGADPVQEWEHKGFYIRSGTTIHELAIFARILDINTIADLEILISFTDPNGRWDSVGVDNDAEDNHTTLYRGFWKAGGSGVLPVNTPLNDEIRRSLPCSPNNDGSGPFTAPVDGQLRLYIRPVNVDPRPNTTTDFVQMSCSYLLSYGGG